MWSGFKLDCQYCWTSLKLVAVEHDWHSLMKPLLWLDKGLKEAIGGGLIFVALAILYFYFSNRLIGAGWSLAIFLAMGCGFLWIGLHAARIRNEVEAQRHDEDLRALQAQLDSPQADEEKREILERLRAAEMNAASAGQLATVAHSAATSMATRMDAAPAIDRATERRNRIGEWRSTLVGSRRKSRNPKEQRSFAQVFIDQPQYQSLKGHLSETTIEALNTGYVNERLVSDAELEQMITDDIFRKEKEWDLL